MAEGIDPDSRRDEIIALFIAVSLILLFIFLKLWQWGEDRLLLFYYVQLILTLSAIQLLMWKPNVSGVLFITTGIASFLVSYLLDLQLSQPQPPFVILGVFICFGFELLLYLICGGLALAFWLRVRDDLPENRPQVKGCWLAITRFSIFVGLILLARHIVYIPVDRQGERVKEAVRATWPSFCNNPDSYEHLYVSPKDRFLPFRPLPDKWDVNCSSMSPGYPHFERTVHVSKCVITSEEHRLSLSPDVFTQTLAICP